jgi:hypothetical protein
MHLFILDWIAYSFINHRLSKMGLFSRFANWIHLKYVRLRERFGIPKYRHGELDHYEIHIFFMDGSNVEWQGTPWGSLWEDFKSLLRASGPIYEIYTNELGDYWEGGYNPYYSTARLTLT